MSVQERKKESTLIEMGIIKESLDFERGNTQKTLDLGILKSLEKQGVHIWFGWGDGEGEKEKEKSIENISEIKEFFDLLKKNGVDPNDMEISHHDFIRIKAYEVINGNHVIFNCLNEKQAQDLIEECIKRSINTYEGNFTIGRGETHINFTKYMKKWLNSL
jgi:tRNA G10  N-methylase Trm11